MGREGREAVNEWTAVWMWISGLLTGLLVGMIVAQWWQP